MALSDAVTLTSRVLSLSAELKTLYCPAWSTVAAVFQEKH